MNITKNLSNIERQRKRYINCSLHKFVQTPSFKRVLLTDKQKEDFFFILQLKQNKIHIEKKKKRFSKNLKH